MSEIVQIEAGEPDDDGFVLSFDWETEVWIPAAAALRQLVDLYAETRDGDRSRAERDAIAMLLRRLEEGQLWARAPNWRFSLDNALVVEDPRFEDLGRVHASSESADAIGPSFWANISEARQHGPGRDDWGVRSFHEDWVAGDFRYLRTWENMRGRNGEITQRSTTLSMYAYGVAFNKSGLPGAGFDEAQNAPRTRAEDNRPTRRPRLSQTTLYAWWDGLGEAAKALPLDTLWHLCRVAFPENSIARDRIRDLVRALDPGRKPGPKPISDNPTA